MADPSHTPGPFRSLSYQAVQVLLKSWPALLRAAVVPYVLAVLIVVLARMVGAPERVALDGLHGLVVITYLTAVARIAAGTAPGACFLTLAIPRPFVPGKKIFWSMVGDGLVLVIPVAFVLFVLAANIGPLINMVGSVVLSVASSLLVEFILSTLVGLVIGAGMTRVE